MKYVEYLGTQIQVLVVDMLGVKINILVINVGGRIVFFLNDAQSTRPVTDTCTKS